MNKALSQMKFESSYSKEYKFKIIQNSAIYTKKLEDNPLKLYYLVLWKNYSKEENTWEPALAIQHFQKLRSIFHKEHLQKSIAISFLVNIALPMARSTTKSITNQKLSRPAKATGANKRAKKNWASSSIFWFFHLPVFSLRSLTSPKNFFYQYTNTFPW